MWRDDLSNIAEVGIIPDDVMMRAARSWSATQKWFPDSSEFAAFCRGCMQQFQRQRYDLKRLLAATVETQKPTEAEFEARKARSDEVRGLFKELQPSEREAQLRKKWSKGNISAKYSHLPPAARTQAMMQDIELEHRIDERNEPYRGREAAE